MGRAASRATLAAETNVAASADAPASADSAAGTRMIVGATAVNASRTSVIRPSAGTGAAAAPTTAISIAWRYSSRMYAEPPPAGTAGTVTSVSSSPGAADVCPGPVARSATGIVRVPPDERSVRLASNTSNGATVSAAGDAFIRLPPIVPVPRVAGEPTIAAPSASAVQPRR